MEKMKRRQATYIAYKLVSFTFLSGGRKFFEFEFEFTLAATGMIYLI